MPLPVLHSTRPRPLAAVAPDVQLIIDGQHFDRIITHGLLKARVGLDIMTADFKAMLIPTGPRGTFSSGPRAQSIVHHLRRLADRGVEIRLLHAGVPSSAALLELKKELPTNLTIRRCPRLHSKTLIIDGQQMYLGSANLTGAGLGAKADGKRNFEMGIWTRRPDLIDPVMDQFNALWEGHQCRTCRRKDVCPVPLEEPKLTLVPVR